MQLVECKSAFFTKLSRTFYALYLDLFFAVLKCVKKQSWKYLYVFLSKYILLTKFIVHWLLYIETLNLKIVLTGNVNS